MSGGKIRVLVVDDSAFARKVMRESLSSDPRIEVVGIARDGLDALEKIAELTPDVVTLDLVMPQLDGLGVLAALKARESGPRVVVVSMSDAESLLGLAALEAGAVDLVHKPTALATDRLYELSGELIEKVVLAASASPKTAGKARPVRALVRQPRSRVVVVGASTGGPRAITLLLAALPSDFPVPIAVVVHMPLGYTEAFAARLDTVTPLRVVEASNGALLSPGTVTIARAGLHLRLGRTAGNRVEAKLDVEPVSTPHRPSVDVLLASAAEAFGKATVGVVLTGMGADGLQGARAIRAAGGTVLVEAASSCVVYGMPRAVSEAGLADAEVPLEGMAEAIAARL
jgi:two-component system, chemotaxis family, protein-glutamate methylesterase/glutaminase